ncbi:hypothetical protein WN48_10725 [Eufriesea mexicana]|uniref:Uncharacterized protein n=1 Tax=Eufriesea mexicana TaxID=516756 RepID=A0A310S9I0_9HYME|nr:hypothetical protein WN48_10725 [Eufriesea mexicana]
MGEIVEISQGDAQQNAVNGWGDTMGKIQYWCPEGIIESSTGGSKSYRLVLFRRLDHSSNKPEKEEKRAFNSSLEKRKSCTPNFKTRTLQSTQLLIPPGIIDYGKSSTPNLKRRTLQLIELLVTSGIIVSSTRGNLVP